MAMNKFMYLLPFLLLISCDDNVDHPTGGAQDDFDRRAMLENWAENIIVPAYDVLLDHTGNLVQASEDFVVMPSFENFQNLDSSWEEAYLVFQDVSMFEIGKAENVGYTNNLNIYPVNVNGLEKNVLNGDYNLELPSEIAMQGFPALDYLLHGIGDNAMGVVSFYQDNENANQYLSYLLDVSRRIHQLTEEVVDDWSDGYEQEFIENNGNNALSSVDKSVNNYIYYYERHLRAGKVGIAAGVFSGDVLPQNVEAYYKNDISKKLFLRSLGAVQNFFLGKHYQDDAFGESLKSYLDYLDVKKDGENLSSLINQQFNQVRMTASNLSDSFSQQVAVNNSILLETYDELQRNVILLKVDMLQAMNINVDYIDADGD